jgi:indole-3-glycerol phosphate synthase
MNDESPSRNLLEEIFTHKRAEIARQKTTRPLAEVRREAENAPPPLDFLAALAHAPARPALIPEIKRKSPSRGLLNPAFDPLRLARIFAENGAAAISVLTDERYFGGHLDHLRRLASRAPRLPLLRKDFLYDPYQVYEARAAGADAVLLIVAGLERSLLLELHGLARSLGMAPLVEIHTQEEIQPALDCRPVLLGINNRNLHDFSVQIETTLHLAPQIPPGLPVVAESGIRTRADVACLAEAGIAAMLVGEAFATAPDIGAKVRELALQ